MLRQLLGGSCIWGMSRVQWAAVGQDVGKVWLLLGFLGPGAPCDSWQQVVKL